MPAPLRSRSSWAALAAHHVGIGGSDLGPVMAYEARRAPPAR